jgi:hypothetical protein
MVVTWAVVVDGHWLSSGSTIPSARARSSSGWRPCRSRKVQPNASR